MWSSNFIPFSLTGIFRSCYDNALRWLQRDVTDDRSTMAQVMAWCHQTTSEYLSKCWSRYMLPYGINRPQWVNNGSNHPQNIGDASPSPSQIRFVWKNKKKTLSQEKKVEILVSAISFALSYQKEMSSDATIIILGTCTKKSHLLCYFSLNRQNFPEVSWTNHHVLSQITGLTHWGRVRYMCHQPRPSLIQIKAFPLFGTKPLSEAVSLSIVPLGTNFSQLVFKIQTFSFTKMHLKILSWKYWPFCLSLKVLIKYWNDIHPTSHCLNSGFAQHRNHCTTKWQEVLINIDSGCGLIPSQHQAFTWTNTELFSMGLIGINSHEIMKSLLKMSSAKWQPFCSGLNVFIFHQLERSYWEELLSYVLLVSYYHKQKSVLAES